MNRTAPRPESRAPKARHASAHDSPNTCATAASSGCTTVASPGSGRTNIDHLAIGPGGSTVIDTTNHRGKVRVERVGGLFAEPRIVLIIAGRDQTRPIRGVEAQIAARRDVGQAAIDIRGALRFANVMAQRTARPVFDQPIATGDTGDE